MKYNRVFYYRYEPNICGGKTIIINGSTGEIYKTSLIGCKILDYISDCEEITVDEISEKLQIQNAICNSFINKLIEVGIIKNNKESR